MICGMCNSNISNNNTFCPQCGTRIIPEDSFFVIHGISRNTVLLEDGSINWRKSSSNVFDEEIRNFRDDIYSIVQDADYCFYENDKPSSSEDIRHLKNSVRKLYYPEIGSIITLRQSFEITTDSTLYTHYCFRFTIESYSFCDIVLYEFYLADSSGKRIDKYIYYCGGVRSSMPNPTMKFCAFLPRYYSPSEVYVVIRLSKTLLFERRYGKTAGYEQVCFYDSIPRFLTKGENLLFQNIKDTIIQLDWKNKKITPEEISKYINLYPTDSFAQLKLHLEDSVSESEEIKHNLGKGTSLREQELFYYIKQFFPDAVNREIISGFEVDIYIPSVKIGIEYDGVFWHKDSLINDTRKNTTINQRGIYLIRIREEGLPNLPHFWGNVYTAKVQLDGTGQVMNDIIVSVIHQLAKYSNNAHVRDQMNTFSLTETELLERVPAIYASIYNEPIPDKLSLAFIKNLWDYEKNEDLRPENTPNNIIYGVWIKCCNGISELRRINAYTREKAVGKLCPFSDGCKLNCQYMHDQLYNYLNNPDHHSSAKPSYELRQWLANNPNNALIELIQKRVQNQLNETQLYNFDFLYFFGFHGEDASNNNIIIQNMADSRIIDLVKKLMDLYPNAGFVNVVHASSFDTTDEMRSLLIDYYRWCITTSRFKNHLYTFFPFTEYKNNTLSPKLVAMLSRMLNEKEVSKLINHDERRDLFNGFYYFPQYSNNKED